MAYFDHVTSVGGDPPPAEVKVWDPLVRIFHWSLAALFLGTYLTGDEIEWMHIRMGYAIAALLAFRLVWGVIGTRRARFTDFVKGPRTVFAYLTSLAAGRAPRYIGHNPAGGAMILMLGVSLIGSCVSGYLMSADPLWGAKWIEEVHEAFAHLSLGLVVLHVAGVVVSSVLHGENLIKAMITGRKKQQL